MPDDTGVEKRLFCSFCSKRRDEVRTMIAGPSVYICNECVALCNEIIRDEEAGAATETTEFDPPAQEDSVHIVDEEAFEANLRGVIDKVENAADIDHIMLELSPELCSLLQADRLTIYAAEGARTLVSKVKTGLGPYSWKDLKLPLADHLIAGYAGLMKKTLNLRDVYNEQELKAHGPNLRFPREVDRRTGYRTRQMLLVPLLDPDDGSLLGLLQAINTKSGLPFTDVHERAAKRLAEALAPAFKNLPRDVHDSIRGKYKALIDDGTISAADFESAVRSARKNAVDVESLLTGQAKIGLPAIGAALAGYFAVPYEPFKPGRARPTGLLANLERVYFERDRWLPIEGTEDELTVLCLDPEALRASTGIVRNAFPKAKVAYRVTTNEEFKRTLDAFYGSAYEA